ncbi:Transient receptor potential cation channel subfamily V member 6 [Portunus trituberculatus]|uniref:Transient receptor potential cation channel subfamily V member 6 n=1 Tax=Portunus trituberculatus TaxID=210409 RepID=A0A5B7FVW6_PORTR|nr:Transient receptor potential cation channel subfamily V member 6 [Portunus trituberculatus]
MFVMMVLVVVIVVVVLQNIGSFRAIHSISGGSSWLLVVVVVVVGVVVVVVWVMVLVWCCRGFKTVGPFVTMIYTMLVGDLLRFVTIYFVFIMGFSQGGSN